MKNFSHVRIDKNLKQFSNLNSLASCDTLLGTDSTSSKLLASYSFQVIHFNKTIFSTNIIRFNQNLSEQSRVWNNVKRKIFVLHS
jgi:hypothetical protein